MATGTDEPDGGFPQKTYQDDWLLPSHQQRQHIRGTCQATGPAAPRRTPEGAVGRPHTEQVGAPRVRIPGDAAAGQWRLQYYGASGDSDGKLWHHGGLAAKDNSGSSSSGYGSSSSARSERLAGRSPRPPPQTDGVQHQTLLPSESHVEFNSRHPTTGQNHRRHPNGDEEASVPESVFQASQVAVTDGLDGLDLHGKSE